MSRLRDILRLTRASLALSPLADVLAGAATAQAGGAAIDARAVAAAAVAGTACFVFGMTLNDVADRAKDAVTSPSRPLPSGAVSLTLARLIVVAAVIVALLAAAQLPRAAQACVVAMLVLISAYNVLPKHGGFLGVLMLASIRGLDLLLGAAALGVGRTTWIAAAGYAVFMGLISAFARREDGEVPYVVGIVPRTFFGMIWTCLAIAIAIPIFGGAPPLVHGLAAILVIPFGTIPFLGAVMSASSSTPDPVTLRRLVGLGLSRLYVYDALVALSCGAGAFAAVIGACFFVTRQLVRRFPPS